MQVYGLLALVRLLGPGRRDEAAILLHRVGPDLADLRGVGVGYPIIEAALAPQLGLLMQSLPHQALFLARQLLLAFRK